MLLPALVGEPFAFAQWMLSLLSSD